MKTNNVLNVCKRPFDWKKSAKNYLSLMQSALQCAVVERRASRTWKGDMSKVLDEIRKAIKKSKLSRYAISKATGIDQGHLSKLMAGQAGLSVDRLELLADFLELEITIRPKRKGK